MRSYRNFDAGGPQHCAVKQVVEHRARTPEERYPRIDAKRKFLNRTGEATPLDAWVERQRPGKTRARTSPHSASMM